MSKLVISIIILKICFCSVGLIAQNDLTRDNTDGNRWNNSFHVVDIPSTMDGKIQKAYLYSSKSKTSKPLIVSLHTWSGDYTQNDPLTKEILARDWNYIHPNFRGPNNIPESTGSNLVIADIEDAIQYALKHTNSDPDDVHIIGVSGGGFATLVAYMNIRFPVKSFSAWAPISDLEAWYWESVGRKQKYADDIFKSMASDSIFNSKEALKRSPLMQNFPKDLRKNAKLYIYEGIHDGYEGSVPITHSINMYNRLVGELKHGLLNVDSITSFAVSDSSLVAENEIISLLTKRYNPEYDSRKTLFDRNIYLNREYKNIRLIIFEGGHEQIPQALGLIPYKNVTELKYNILTIGDSNGQIPEGWVEQLKKMMPGSNIVNISKGGRTIGFDNNGRKELNALRNIDNYLNDAQKLIKKNNYDFIIVCLGTNDTKSVFSERQNEVVSNFNELLEKIKKHPVSQKTGLRLIYVTPPPIRTTEIQAKYEGGNERLVKLIPEFKSISEQKGFEFIDVFNPLSGILEYYAFDGVHMEGAGQQIIAMKIIEVLQNK